MNLIPPVESSKGRVQSLTRGDSTNAQITSSFHEDQRTVPDSVAEFYLEKIKPVFLKYALAQGLL